MAHLIIELGRKLSEKELDKIRNWRRNIHHRRPKVFRVFNDRIECASLYGAAIRDWLFKHGISVTIYRGPSENSPRSIFHKIYESASINNPVNSLIAPIAPNVTEQSILIGSTDDLQPVLEDRVITDDYNIPYEELLRMLPTVRTQAMGFALGIVTEAFNSVYEDNNPFRQWHFVEFQVSEPKGTNQPGIRISLSPLNSLDVPEAKKLNGAIWDYVHAAEGHRIESADDSLQQAIVDVQEYSIRNKMKSPFLQLTQRSEFVTYAEGMEGEIFSASE